MTWYSLFKIINSFPQNWSKCLSLFSSFNKSEYLHKIQLSKEMKMDGKLFLANVQDKMSPYGRADNK